MKSYLITRAISKKVLMVGNYYKHHHPGGISAVIDYWSQYIEDLQYYPTWKLGNLFTKAWWFVTSYIRIFFRLLCDKEIKIVHLHFAADGSFWRKKKLSKLSKIFKKKLILHCHASRFKDFYYEASTKKKSEILKTLKTADVLIVLSDSWKSWFVSIGITENKIIVLHNITSPPTLLPYYKNKDGKIHFLFLGEIGKRKGVFDILRGIAKRKDELEGKLELRIGGNSNEKMLLDFIQNNQLEHMVKFEGWVSGTKKIELLNWADVFILPSFNEGLPISILEAMSYSMPIISTPIGGIPEVVSEKNGILVTPGNEQEIINAMKIFINNPEIIKIYGNHSKDIVRTYLPDYVLGHLKEIYQNLLE